MTADTPETDWEAVAPTSWDADYASLWARFQQASERATKWHACCKEAVAERDAAIARLQAGGCARDQTTTQYCAEAAAFAAERDQLLQKLQELAKDVREITVERDAAIEWAETAEAERDALVGVARAARLLVTRDDFWGGVDHAIPGELDDVTDALDALPPGLGQSDT